MSAERTVAYLREKGQRYLYQAQQDDDAELLERAKTYLRFADELQERLKNFVV